MNEQNKNKHIDTENKVIIARWVRVGGIGEIVEEIKKYRLDVTK